jgi:FlaA1/EpsC-like NDP-sugar epimerase
MVQTLLLSGQSTEDKKEIHVITGGGGYVGQNLTEKLLDSDVSVVLFDLNEPKDDMGVGVTFIQVNVKLFFFFFYIFLIADRIYKGD